MADCKINIELTKVVKELQTILGNDKTNLLAHLNFIKDKDGYDFKFTSKLKEVLDVDINDIPNNKVKEVANFIADYYNQYHADVEYSAISKNEDDNISRYGYTNIEARDFSKRISANFVKDVLSQIKYIKKTTLDDVIKELKNKTGKNFTKKDYLASAVVAKIKKEIINRIAFRNIASKEEVLKALKTNNISQLEKWFNKDLQSDVNLLAFYKEIVANRNNFFKKVFRDSRLGKARLNKDEDLSEDIDYETIDEQIDVLDTEEIDEGNTTEDVKDNTISEYNNHLGDVKNYLDNISNDIKNYLGSLPIVKDVNELTGDYNYDTDNYLGIPDVMDSRTCCVVLLSYGNFTNPDLLIASVKDIAKQLPGFASFKIFADKLESDKDFLFEVYSNFGKTVLGKIESIVNGEEFSDRISNYGANKNTLLRFEYLNSIRSTALIVDDLNSSNIYKKIKERIDRINDSVRLIANEELRAGISIEELKLIDEELNKDIDTVVVEIATLLRKYYPTIDENTIAFYVNSANEGNKIRSLNNLTSVLANTINASYKTLDNYKAVQIEVESIRKRKKELKKQRVNVEETIRNIYKKDFVDEDSKSAAFVLADMLVNYTTVKVDLNSRNVHGNLSSDLLNNSMITNLINTLKSTIGLENYGKYRSQTRQYDFSNIMIEQTDDDGNIISYGLFKLNRETGEYTPTSYAQRLIRCNLFNGASNFNSNQNVVYSQMSKGDYTATAFINYFYSSKDYNIKEEGHDIEFADYFMRVPSDAPKNFIISSPKYSIYNSLVDNDGLFIIDNLDEINNQTSQRIANIPRLDEDTFEEEYNVTELRPNYVDLITIVRHLTSKKISDFTVNEKDINESKVKKGDRITITYHYKTKDNDEDIYVLEGTLDKVNGRKIIKDPKLLGLVGTVPSMELNQHLYNYFRNKIISNGNIKYKININHIVFKQIKNIFMQELSDMANALDLFFKNDNGLIAINTTNNLPTFKDGFDNSKETANRTFDLYHHGKNKTIFNVKDDGSAQLTGAVFKSTKFKVYSKKRNYGQEILDEAFNFLYGGGNGSYIHTKALDNGVVPVLTPEQEAIVNSKLIEFIIDYTDEFNNRITQYENFIPESLLNKTDVDEFALNYFITYNSFDDLFEGSSKFYKNSQTFLKRAKESQGSGVPYGIVDYNIDLTKDIEDIESPLDKIEFEHKTKDGKVEKVKYTLRNRFKGVTINNTIRDTPELAIKGINKAKEDGALTKKLIDSFKQKGYNAKEARRRAIDLIASKNHDGEHGFYGTTVNDAQSYITFEEWVRRITIKGQLPKYKKLIEAILDETKEIDPEIVSEFIQVQKNFYYDLHYNKDLKTIAPRQIKNAEFVLVKRFIKGTQLEQVYDLMRDNDIDQLNTAETSKAAKANVLTLWDDEGNIPEENAKAFNNNAKKATELFSYNYLYIQQETPQHMNSENKAGIQIVKKMFDNIPEGSPLYDVKQKFFRLYCTNIKESHEDLMEELNIDIDSNGNIIFLNDNLKNLNLKVFFDMLQEEVARLGLDSNMMDYVTLAKDQIFEDDGRIRSVTLMPTYLSGVSKKLESIAQSIFNNRIVRQKLPGFHAAQITGIGFDARNDKVEYRLNEAGKGRGFKEVLTPEEYKKLPAKNKMYYSKAKGNIMTSSKLKYHPNGEAYIEVMLPASAFGLKRVREDGTVKTDDELLKELEDAKMDKFIGYRIPTEGKQSVCVMKVVGFLDDKYGSTIVVPDGWVSQTGSDFDIDSVYAIVFKGRQNKITGKIEKVNYITSRTEQDYFSYIRRSLERKLVVAKVGEDIEKLKNDILQARNEDYWQLLEAEGEIYHELPENIREEIKKVQDEKDEGATKLERYISQNNRVIEYFTNYINEHGELTEDVINKLNEFISIRKEIRDFISNTSEAYKEDFVKGKEKILSNRLKGIESIAEENGLLSFEEFKNETDENINSKTARSNEILQCMLEVLSSDEMLEENLSRSNFDKIIEARDSLINEEVKNEREERSPYNFLDQAEYQEDVMSGAKLKAFSVTRDTFVSVCNTVKPEMPTPFCAIYYEADGYTYKDLVKSFGADNVKDLKDGRIRVEHRMFGWSNDNRNVEGMLLTTYTSQTTAHILDAVKEGSIPNVNDLTFKVYKCFPDIGSNYQTGISFIMQEGVKNIVDIYNSNKSIYAEGYKNPITEAFMESAIKLLGFYGIDAKDLSQESIINALNKNCAEDLAKLFNVDKLDFKFENAFNIPFNSKLYKHSLDRVEEFSSSPVGEKNQALLNVAVILQYSNMSDFANGIGEYARVCNPDRFGAKATIFDTNEVFRSISRILNGKTVNILKIDGLSLLTAIYPNINRGFYEFVTHNDVDKSKYPPLYYFLKYVTGSSIVINRRLFPTQSYYFTNTVYYLEKAFLGEKRLDYTTYQSFQNYILNDLYNSTTAIRNKIGFVKGIGFVNEVDGNAEEERIRIYGYNRRPDLGVKDKNGETIQFEVEDINNPTSEEIRQYMTLSPAQKIFWIQSNFDNKGVFSYIKTTLYNQYEARKNKMSMQTIEFVEDSADIETVYDRFNKAFYNSNPLIALAAFDIIKYAFVVEGFKMKRNAVNKMIKNTALMDSDNGTGIVDELNNLIVNLGSEGYSADRIRELYLRSHSDIKNLPYAYLKRDPVSKNIPIPKIDDLLFVDLNTNFGKNLAKEYNFGTFDRNGLLKDVYPYIRIRIDNTVTLYKVELVNGEAIVAYPLNKLEENETSEWSANSNNNDIYPSKDYYVSLINHWEDNFYEQNVSLQGIVEANRELKEKSRYVNPIGTISARYAIPFDLYDKKNVNYGGFEAVVDKVTDYFSKEPFGRLYIRSGALSKYIKYTGEINGSIQTINGKEYLIQKVDFRKYNKAYVKQHKRLKNIDPQIENIALTAEENGYEVNDVYLITPYSKPTVEVIEDTEEEDVYESTITETGSKFYSNIQRQAYLGDETANRIKQRWDRKNIVIKSEALQNNLDEVIVSASEYVEIVTEDILTKIDKFYPLPDGSYLSIVDDAVIDLIKNNKDVKDKFIKLLYDARNIVREYDIINELDIDTQSDQAKPYLNRLKNNINKLKNATSINVAEERFAKDFLSKLSNNPNFQNDVHTILDGYHSATAFDLWVADLQETANPLIQIIAKDVIADINAKEFMGKQRVKEFKAKVKAIKDYAEKNGLKIDWDKIIDENGKFIKDYSKLFVSKIEELRSERDRLKVEKPNSAEYIRAKLTYDEFKAKHTNQRLVPDYYFEKLRLEKEIFNTYPTIYVKYMALEAEKANIYSHTTNGVLEESYKERLKEINKQIKELTTDYFYDEDEKKFVQKRSVSDPNNPLTGEVRKIYNLEAAHALSKYLKDMKSLREEYFTTDARFGFDEQLKENLDTVIDYEKRDANGKLTVPLSELYKHEDYVKAKEWLANNARYVYDEKILLKVNNAFEVLNQGKKKNKGRKVLINKAKQRDAYDSEGNIDATKFTEEDIRDIKEEQLANYNIRENPINSDRILISNAPSDEVVFYDHFYNGMKVEGMENPEYLEIVRQINTILAPYYDPQTKKVETYNIPESQLDKLSTLYERLENVKKTIDPTNGKQVYNYISSNVDFIVDEKTFNEQKEFARQKGEKYYQAWCNVNLRLEETKDSMRVVPNKRLYGYAVPKGYKADGTGDNSMVDVDKTKAKEIVKNYTTVTISKYYYEKYREMRAKSDEEFNKWYADNHIYNIYTHTVVPIACWTKMEIVEMAEDGKHNIAGTWVPAYNQKEIVPKKEYINKDFKPKASTVDNYIKTSDKTYDNDIVLNQAEIDMRNLFESTLLELTANSRSASNFIKKGYMVARTKGQEVDSKFLANQMLKMFGWIEGESGRESWYKDVDTDRDVEMPMAYMLRSKDSIKIDNPPVKRENETDEQFNKRKEEYDKYKKEAEEQNAKVHADLLDRNWESVMEDFIIKAAHFNAVQDNKYMLFYGKSMIDRLKVYDKTLGFNNYKLDDNDNYARKLDTNLQKQYANWVRRLIYNQYKEPNNKYTRIANLAQSFTSAKFMMLNITGGIANVTLGETQILAEVFAKEYFNLKDYAKGKKMWLSSVVSFINDMYSEKATSLASAIVKFFNVIDFDELNGVVTVPDSAEYFKRARDLAFSPQAMGEHFMQNGALFTLLYSNRLVKNVNSPTGYSIMSEGQYIVDKHQKALMEILTDEQLAKWNKFKKAIKEDANLTKEYARFERDLTTEFVNLYLNNEQKREFISKRNELVKEAEEEFNNDENNPTLISQLKLDEDGTLGFKDESILTKIGNEKSYRLLGELKGKAISVNKKIHGVYDKIGAATIESQWWGGLVMQYHKHIYPGIMKRYRRQGYFNEERGTIEKGAYNSIKDFLALPLHKAEYIKKLQADTEATDAEISTIKSIQNLCKNYVEFTSHITLNWNILPEHDRANMRRALGDLAGVVSSLCFAVAIRVAADDDEGGILFNLAMYETDRLASESFMYNPLGLISEGKKLWSSPLAVQGVITDTLNGLGLVAQYIMQGDDFDPYYENGLYAGENKLEVRLKRNIPMYHAIHMIQRLERNNSYYKLGENMLTIIPVKDIADWIKD